MSAARNLRRVASSASWNAPRRSLHASTARCAVSNLTMPAMSPTMTEGGIASWKKTAGESFSVGDILLEIETDKATMDVEAQDDGIMGLIVTPDGSKNVPVGQIIALLAEEGDDISNLEAPVAEVKSTTAAPSSTSPPPTESSKPSTSSAANPNENGKHAEKATHPRPLFPSVMRLLQENGVTDATGIKGTGVRGMLTKGDVLAHFGKASSPWGTAKDPRITVPSSPAAPPAKKEEKALDAADIRRLMIAGLAAKANPPAVAKAPDVTFWDVIRDYEPSAPVTSVSTGTPTRAQTSYADLDGLI